MTGAKLKDYLDEAEAGSSFTKNAIAMGYVAGVFDSNVQREVCPNGQIDDKKAMGIVHRFLRAHPQRLGEDAAGLVVEALREAFPCHK